MEYCVQLAPKNEKHPRKKQQTAHVYSPELIIRLPGAIRHQAHHCTLKIPRRWGQNAQCSRLIQAVNAGLDNVSLNEEGLNA